MTTAQEEEVRSAQPAFKTPNLYLLRAAQLHITYSTTSFDGKPHFDYQDAAQTLTFKGDQIRTATTEIGTLVTVTIAVTVDRGSTTFTLLVPRVNLPPSNQVPLDTQGITTIHRFSVAPQLNQGQIELYTIMPLTGTASLVVF